jgi:hypothetical protein
MNTIVSAFVSNINNRDDITLKRYYELGKLLLKSTVPKIIFVDKTMFNLINLLDYDISNTNIVKIEKTDIYLYEHINSLSQFNLNTDNPKKDTIEYIITQCNKTEWVKSAIELNTFNTNNFIWVDFGIRYIFNCSDEEFIEKINKLKYKVYKNVRIGNIWNLQNSYNINIYKDIAWYFAGGIFGGNKESLLHFSNKIKEKCIDIILKKNTLMWEVNIWYLIYIENKEIFDNYSCNHNNSIIDNY